MIMSVTRTGLSIGTPGAASNLSRCSFSFGSSLNCGVVFRNQGNAAGAGVENQPPHAFRCGSESEIRSLV
jgi:hypothetical protein